MPYEDLLERTLRFAERVVRFSEKLPNTPAGRKVGAQLVDAGTGIGANYRSSRRARSKKEFIARMGVVVEESEEAVYWLAVIKNSQMSEGDDLEWLRQEAGELLRIFGKSLHTAKSRPERPRP